MHSLFMYGGHNVLQSALTNPVYRFSNPNYPPLVPASGALGFVAEGGVDLRLAVIMTAVLNTCTLGAVGCAIVRDRGGHSSPPSPYYGAGLGSVRRPDRLRPEWRVRGGRVHADLLWAASALAAVIIGLLVPRQHAQPGGSLGLCDCGWPDQDRRVYHGLRDPGTPCHPPHSRGRRIHSARRSAPPRESGAWPGSRRFDGRARCLSSLSSWPCRVSSGWAHPRGSEAISSGVRVTLSLRLRATEPTVWSNLHIVPYAVCVAVVGRWF